MRFLALLLSLAAWAGVGKAVYDMCGYWDHATTAHILWHSYAIVFLLIAPFILNALVGINDALRLYSTSAGALAQMTARKAEIDQQVASLRNNPRSH